VDSDSNNGAFETDYAYSGPITILDNEYALLLAGTGIKGSTEGVFADTGSQYGYFKTIEIESGTVQHAYERVYAKAKTMTSGEKINIKYRTVKKDRVTCDVAYQGTTQFNTTDDLSSITADVDDIYHWEAVDIHTGKTAQVIDVVASGSTYAVYVDGDIGTDGETGRIELQNWTKVNDDYDTDYGEIKSWGDFGVNPWIQFKVTLDGAIEMRQFMLKSNSKNEV